MALKDQWKKIKENWLIALALVILAVLIMSQGSIMNAVPSLGGFETGSRGYPFAAPSEAFTEQAMAKSAIYDEGFAPEVEERKITKTASFSNEVERGKFKEAEAKLKSVVTATDSYMLNENSWLSGSGIEAYYSGSYMIKVETKKYDAVITQLKEIGEIQSFSENKEDVTESYTDLNIELQAEKERLKRYEEMYAEASTIDEKIQLSDRIFDQERRVKYLEESLENIDQRVDYSTIYVSLTEKQSKYVGIALVGLSELVRDVVSSFNSVLILLFTLLPYALAALLVWLGIRFVKKRNKP